MPTDPERCYASVDFCFQVVVSGDFDGNGLVDGAVMTVSEAQDRQALWVFMYDRSHAVTWKKLDEAKFSGTISMGVSEVPAGTHDVLCHSQEECEGGYKEPIQLANDAFSYYRFASSSSLWVFDNGTFQRVWEDD